MQKRGGEKITKNHRGKQTQKTPKRRPLQERTKQKPRTEGGETEKRRSRAFSSRCLHCYLRFRLQLHQVKSYSSLCFCVIVARKQCKGN
jgi:hypothetical protein